MHRRRGMKMKKGTKEGGKGHSTQQNTEERKENASDASTTSCSLTSYLLLLLASRFYLLSDLFGPACSRAGAGLRPRTPNKKRKGDIYKHTSLPSIRKW